MPVDYSKWDALELSDDSDIEVHPNVDKRSFIRAKQNQIHQDRYQRKQEIDTLKYERIVNDGLLARIDRLISSLNAHASKLSAVDASSESDSGRKPSPDELVFRSLIESAGDPAHDQPPPPPAGVHANVKEQPSYSKMMAALVDQVKKTVDEERKPNTDQARIEAFSAETGAHKTKVLDLQQQLLKRLAELQKLEGSKITSESYNTGFSASSISKTAFATHETAPTENSKPKSKTSKKQQKEVQLLNKPSSTGAGAEANEEHSSGSEADTEDNPPSALTTTKNPDPALPSPIKDRTVHPTPLGLQFAALPPNAYQAYLNFIAAHPSVLAERETDGLLMRAFDLQYANKPTESRHAVHQALLLQYCRSLGKDGVALFFKRVTSPQHQARKMFVDDVNQTYSRLATRAKEMEKEVGTDGGDDDGELGEAGGDVEQIQLHAVNPGQRIQIVVPPPLDECADDDARMARTVFEAFKPNLRKALETGELDEVNKVLGRMKVDEAEEVVGELGEGGMLSLEEGVVDATTEEGRELLKGMEEGRVEEIGEPGGVIEEVKDREDKEERLAVDEVD